MPQQPNSCNQLFKSCFAIETSNQHVLMAPRSSTLASRRGTRNLCKKVSVNPQADLKQFASKVWMHSPQSYDHDRTDSTANVAGRGPSSSLVLLNSQCQGLTDGCQDLGRPVVKKRSIEIRRTSVREFHLVVTRRPNSANTHSTLFLFEMKHKKIERVRTDSE